MKEATLTLCPCRSAATGEATSWVRSRWLASPSWRRQRLKNWPPNWAERTWLDFLYIKVIKSCLSATVSWRLGCIQLIVSLSVWSGGRGFPAQGLEWAQGRRWETWGTVGSESPQPLSGTWPFSALAERR